MKIKTISRVYPKRNLQAMLTALRQAGLEVTKLSAGYECVTPSGVTLLKAMNGSRGYLTTHAADLFS
jgi:hypothetical protein